MTEPYACLKKSKTIENQPDLFLIYSCIQQKLPKMGMLTSQNFTAAKKGYLQWGLK